MRLILLATLLPLTACHSLDDARGVQGSGTGGTRTFAITEFTAVDLHGSDDVRVTVGPAFAVRAEGRPAVLDRLKIERDGDTLRVGRRNGSWRDDAQAQVLVSMPAIRRARIAGSGDMTIDRAAGARFTGQVAGSGTLAVHALAVQATDLDSAGSGDIAAGGEAGVLTVRIAGSGNVDAAGLHATGADVSVMGSGDVRARVTGAARVNLMGSGDADLGPDARCEARKMGSGAVRCGG
jgi:hypothetical protein